MPSGSPVEPLKPEALRRICDPSVFPFATTDELEPTDRIIGQDRATQAIRLGLQIQSEGFNIFVAGHVGTGRNTTIDRFLEVSAREGPAPPDLVYVYNFKDPDRPRLLVLPAGQGAGFREAVEKYIEGLKRGIPAIFESDEYARERKAFIEGYRERQKAMIKAFEEQIEKENFVLVQIQMGPITRPSLVPVIAGNPMKIEQLEDLVSKGKYPSAEFGKIQERHDALSEAMESVLKKVHDTDKEAESRLEQLDVDLVLPIIHDPLVEMRRTFAHDAVGVFFDQLEEGILLRLDGFRGKEDESSGEAGPQSADPFLEYRVNLLVDNTATKGPPVVNETSPSYKNLFGAVEKAMDRAGEWRTDHMRIKAGSLVRANGGYIVLNAEDVLKEPGVWPALKRTLRNGILEIQTYDPIFMFTTSVLKPEPIPCSVKVCMVGDKDIYRLLYNYDPDFRKTFKVKADFDTTMKLTPESVVEYAGFIRKITSSEKLPAFDRAGVAAVVEHGTREAGRRDRLSTRFAEIADVVREAAWIASREGGALVGSEQVRRALAARRERVSLPEEKLREVITDGMILIDTQGAKIGQVNGLAVFDLGDHAFGGPARITATLAMGRAGIVNVEREADVSGPFHNKGVLILTGYLRSLFAQDKPLSMSASVCFEQSYAGVDGDSAASTEIYALLSAIGEVPLRQDLAVTGSINQMGDIQPIGGVNEKIEGWFAICKSRGLSGTQGVIIPTLNVRDLMLDSEVVEAVRDGKFRIYPVRRVEEGIELLTGIPAGARGADGSFPAGTVFARVDARLRDLAEKIRYFGPPGPQGD